MCVHVLARIHTGCLCEEEIVEAEVRAQLERDNPNRDFMLFAWALCLDGIARNTFQTWLSTRPTFKLTPQNTNICGTVGAPVFHTCRQYYCTDVTLCSDWSFKLKLFYHSYYKVKACGYWVDSFWYYITRKDSRRLLSLSLPFFLHASFDGSLRSIILCLTLSFKSMIAAFALFRCLSGRTVLRCLALRCTAQSRREATLTFTPTAWRRQLGSSPASVYYFPAALLWVTVFRIHL